MARKPTLKPRKVMTASQAAKKAQAGVDMGKPGPGFANIAKKAAARYGSTEVGQKVAGAVFKKMRKKGKL